MAKPFNSQLQQAYTVASQTIRAMDRVTLNLLSKPLLPLALHLKQG